MDNMKAYLFAQAMDNESPDDWYEYKLHSLEKITDENDQSWVNKLIFELTENGKREVFNNIECFYRCTSNRFLDFIFLIDNLQEDKIGRQSKTALIIKDYQDNPLDFEKILTAFWSRTDRNSATVESVAQQCKSVLEIIKKKRNKKSYLVPIALVGLSIILVFLFQKLSKG
ncbi:MAG: hypothetical protein RSB44_13575 [Carnobacterium sp.]